MSMILIGYRGCGKTTIGKKIADRLWQKFVDTDDLVAKAAGKNIRRIFEEDGEPYFRSLEAEAVKQALALPEHVIAVGGGAVLREETRALLKASKLNRLYLKCDPHVLLQRIQADPNTAANRPDLTTLGGGIEEVQQVVAEREPLYREVMTAEVDVTNLSLSDAVVYLVRLS